MKLYYNPGVCSLSPHIVAREAGLPLEIEKVDFASERSASGRALAEINPKGYVPALELDDGTVLTEGATIVQYLADQAPDKQLIPAGGIERYRVQEWLTYIATEVHKGFVPFFYPMGEEAKRFAREKLAKHFDWLSAQLAERPWVAGDRFTVADAYLFTVLNWTDHVEIDLKKWPTLAQYRQKVGARPAVQAALKAEGLI
mgnify:CR=1 FL=1